MKSSWLTSVLIIFLISLQAAPLFAANTSTSLHDPNLAVIDNLDKPFDLAPYVEYIEDVDRSLTYADIQSGRVEERWQRNTNTVFTGEVPEHRYWFRLKINYSANILALHPVLYVPTQNLLIVEFTLWIPENASDSRQINTGVLRADKNRDLDTFQFAFKMPQDMTDIILVGWIDQRHTTIPAILPLHLMSSQQLNQANTVVFGVMIAFYSFMLALLLYNTCLFVSLRQPVYGIYLLFISSAILTCAFIDGSATRLLFSDQPLLNLRLTEINAVMGPVLYTVFLWEALDRFRFSARLRQAFYSILSLGVIAVLHNAFTPNFEHASRVNEIFAGFLLPFAFIVIIASMRHRIPTAGYLLIAEVCAMLGAISFVLVILSKLPFNEFTIWMLHIGFLTETLFLSLALAARTRQAQQEAIRNLASFESLYENSIEGRFQYSLNGGFLKCNHSLAKICGYQSKAAFLADNRTIEFSDDKTNKQIAELLLTKGMITDHAAEITHKNSGNKVWISVTMRMENDAKGRPKLVDGSVVDISERKLREEAQKERQLSEVESKAKSQFFASMSHEFRTPLTAILGYAELAKRNTISSQERHENLRTIEHAGQHLLQLINDILDLSKIEAQKLEVETIKVDIFALLHSTRDYLWILAEQKQIKLSIHYQFPLPRFILSDPTRLQQALINLCSNSIKFTEQGSVSVHVSFEESCDEQQQKINFSIEDTGIGLKPAQLSKLFDAFVQADESVTRKYGGTGLGLHLSKLIALKLGGDITVESEYGRGSVFTLSVATGALANVEWVNNEEPTLQQTAYSNALEVINGAANVENSQATKTYQVLLAEDNPVNQKLITFHIASTGANVVLANDGLEAIAKVLTTDIDLILMDMQMPTMDGMTAVNYLRAKGFAKPIYALTASESPEAMQECEAAGCTGYLAKPLDSEKLKAVIQSVMREVS